jgi:hypothetical protein
MVGDGLDVEASVRRQSGQREQRFSAFDVGEIHACENPERALVLFELQELAAFGGSPVFPVRRVRRGQEVGAVGAGADGFRIVDGLSRRG